MPAAQNYKNHAMIDPLFHFMISPLLVVNFGFSIAVWFHHHAAYPLATLWWIVLSLTFLLLAVKTRVYALRNQDRIIRLEERLRLTALLPASEHAAISSLTTAQLIALRFASDAELPSIARRAWAESLTAKQIKEEVVTWRPDLSRI